MGRILKVLYGFLLILLLLSTIAIYWLGFIGNTYQGSTYLDYDFNKPTEIIQAPNDPNFIYVSEQTGKIFKIENKKGASDVELFLDMESDVKAGGENGFLGMVFHPQYPEIPKFYTYHTGFRENSSTSLRSVLSSFAVTSSGVVEKSSQEIIFSIDLESTYHRAGKLNFDKNGFLLIHIGDDSTFFDAQNLTNFLGSVVRIDIDNPINETMPYSIPSDNPFIGMSNVREEIYAYGLRNPFRGDYDPLTDNYWIGDVGAARWEEINLLQPGNNYGWPYYEGAKCRWNCSDQILSNVLIDYDKPTIAYPHSVTSINNYYDFSLKNKDEIYGAAIIGSNIYRGSIFEEFYGKMLITDYLGLVYTWNLENGEAKFITRFPNPISSTHQLLESNEILFAGPGLSDNSGVIYTLTKRFPFYLTGLILINSVMIGYPIFTKYKRSKNENERISVNEDENSTEI